MSKFEWVRTALAIAHAGSITAGAAIRNISQPAASQQVGSLERSLGIKVFERKRTGVTLTADGARFLHQIATPIDQIEWLLEGLDVGQAELPALPLVIGCHAEWFDRSFMPRLDDSLPIRTFFADDKTILDALLSGNVDIAVTLLAPPASYIHSASLGPRKYVLVASPQLCPLEPIVNDEALSKWIRATPWVGFSEELPATRQFWFAVTGSSNPTMLQLTAPDIRVVATAVEQGVGASLLPYDFCQEALNNNRLVEVAPWYVLPTPPSWILSASKTTKRHKEKDRLMASIIETVEK